MALMYPFFLASRIDKMNPYPQNQPQMYQQQPPYYTQQQPQYYQQPPQQNLVAQPSGVIPNDPSPNAGRGAASRAATKASAYGGSEVGALIGKSSIS